MTEAWRLRAGEARRTQTRHAIVTAATELFARNGYRATTIEAIATQAGVGPASVYNHFAGKHLIAAAAWRPLYDDLEEHVLGLLAQQPFDAPAAVHAHLHRLSEVAIANRSLTVALTQALNNEAARPDSESEIESVRELVPLPGLLIQLLLAGQKTGQLHQDVSAVDVGVFIVSGTVLRILNRTHQDATVLGDLISTLVLAPFLIGH